MIKTDSPDSAEQKQSKNPERVGLVSLAHFTLRQIRRLVILIIGMTVLLIGVIMFVTPGPALIVIPAGLGILALEFAWARRLLTRAKVQVTKTVNSMTNKPEHKQPKSD